MNKLVFSVIVMLAGFQALASETKRSPSNNQVSQYLQTQLENAPNCVLATKASRNPFDKIGTCTTESCKEVSNKSRSFQLSGDRAF